MSAEVQAFHLRWMGQQFMPVPWVKTIGYGVSMRDGNFHRQIEVCSRCVNAYTYYMTARDTLGPRVFCVDLIIGVMPGARGYCKDCGGLLAVGRSGDVPY